MVPTAPSGRPVRRPLTGPAEVGVLAVQMQLVPRALRELGDQREPVTPDQGVPPLDRPVPRVPEPVDGECPHRPGQPEQPLLGPAGRHRADVLLPASQLDPGPGGELVVEGGVGEVGLHQRRGEAGGQPDPVQRERLTPGQAEPFQVEQGGGRLQLQPVGDHPVRADVPGQDHAGLAEPGRLHQGEEGVQRAERLGYQVVGGQPGTAAALGHHDAFCPQVTQRRPDGVPAHVVLRHQRELAGEFVVKGARVEPPPQVRPELRPQRQRAAAVQPPRCGPGHARPPGCGCPPVRMIVHLMYGRPPGKESRPWWKCSRSRRRHSATAATWYTTARPPWSSTRSGTSTGSSPWPATPVCGSRTWPRHTCTTTTSPGALRSRGRPARPTWSTRTTRSPSTAPRSATATGWRSAACGSGRWQLRGTPTPTWPTWSRRVAMTPVMGYPASSPAGRCCTARPAGPTCSARTPRRSSPARSGLRPAGSPGSCPTPPGSSPPTASAASARPRSRRPPPCPPSGTSSGSTPRSRWTRAPTWNRCWPGWTPGPPITRTWPRRTSPGRPGPTCRHRVRPTRPSSASASRRVSGSSICVTGSPSRPATCPARSASRWTTVLPATWAG